jgi:hypothetical protein
MIVTPSFKKNGKYIIFDINVRSWKQYQTDKETTDTSTCVWLMW